MVERNFCIFCVLGLVLALVIMENLTIVFVNSTRHTTCLVGKSRGRVGVIIFGQPINDKVAYKPFQCKNRDSAKIEWVMAAFIFQILSVEDFFGGIQWRKVSRYFLEKEIHASCLSSAICLTDKFFMPFLCLSCNLCPKNLRGNYVSPCPPPLVLKHGFHALLIQYEKLSHLGEELNAVQFFWHFLRGPFFSDASKMLCCSRQS